MEKKIRLITCAGVLFFTLVFGLTLTSRITKADVEPVGGGECNCTDLQGNKPGLLCMENGRMRCCPDNCVIYVSQ